VMAYFYCLLHCPFLYTIFSNNFSWTPGIDLIIYWQCGNPFWRFHFRKQGMISRTTNMNIRTYTRKFVTSIFDTTSIQYIWYLGQEIVSHFDRNTNFMYYKKYYHYTLPNCTIVCHLTQKDCYTNFPVNSQIQ